MTKRLAPLSFLILFGCPSKDDTSGETGGDTAETGEDTGGDTNTETDTGETETAETDSGETDTGETQETDTGEKKPPLSYAADIADLFAGSCVGCHGSRDPAAGLDLTNGYTELVGVASTQATSLKLVDPGSAGTSYLINKLEDTQATVGGYGTRMPPSGAAMSSSQIQIIKDWIDEGANP